MSVATPVEYYGEWYPSLTALAVEIGVSKVAVSRAIKEGRLETCGQRKARTLRGFKRHSTDVEVTCSCCGAVRWYETSKAKNLKSDLCIRCAWGQA